MSKLSGIYDYFPGLDKISVEKVKLLIKRHDDPRILENKLANYLLYPQTIPETTTESLFILAVVKEALTLFPQNFYNPSLKRIYIPERFFHIFPNLQNLAWAFISAFDLSGIITLWLKKDEMGAKSLGTYIKPEIKEKSGLIYISVKNKKYQVKIGSVIIISCEHNKADIKFNSTTATLLGKKELTTEAVGGKLGFIVDAR